MQFTLSKVHYCHRNLSVIPVCYVIYTHCTQQLKLQMPFLSCRIVACLLKACCCYRGLTDGYGDGSVSKCNGLVREKELEPWDGAPNEDSLEAIEATVVDGFDRNEVLCCCCIFVAVVNMKVFVKNCFK